jgi:pimeloyl-ACP methyl ester carboxylesterase
MKGLFTSRDGTPLYYEVLGKGRPLLLSYGLLCRREHWRHQVPYFSTKYQVIIVDYRGHQRSGFPKNERNLTLEWCAKDLLDTADFLGLSDFACLGHSVGVPILAHLTALAPERVKANVFICGSVNNPFQQMLFTDKLDALFQWTAKLFELSPLAAEIFWKRFTQRSAFGYFVAAQLGFNPEVAESRDVESYLEGVRATRPEVFYRLMMDYRSVDRRALLAESTAPTLVIAGDEDCITPLPIQEGVTRLLRRGELEVIQGGSHNAHTDFPDLVNSSIDKFLTKVGYV